MIVIGVLLVIAAASVSAALAVTVAVFAVLAVVSLGIVQSALSAIYSAALYRYATVGEAPAGFESAPGSQTAFAAPLSRRLHVQRAATVHPQDLAGGVARVQQQPAHRFGDVLGRAAAAQAASASSSAALLLRPACPAPATARRRARRR